MGTHGALLILVGALALIDGDELYRVGKTGVTRQWSCGYGL